LTAIWVTNSELRFVNGFAANEPQSTLKIWELVQKMTDLPLENAVIIFNGRHDRVDRTQQFVKNFFPQLKEVTLIGIGQGIKSIQNNMNKGYFPGVIKYIHLENASTEQSASRELIRPYQQSSPPLSPLQAS
jgi:hypothetical protein